MFVYVKDGLGAFGFPVPTEPVVLDQDKCRYTPRVLGVRVGQPLSIRNSDPLLHNVRAERRHQPAFNMSTPLEGVSFTHTFATREVMVPFKCDVHALDDARMSACSIIRTSAPRRRTARSCSATCRPAPTPSKRGTRRSARKTQQVTIAREGIEGCQLHLRTLTTAAGRRRGRRRRTRAPATSSR